MSNIRAIIVTMVYSNDKVFQAGMSSLYSTVDMTKHNHVLVDCCYPLNKPDLAAFAESNGCRLITLPENRGLHQNANAAIKELDDVLILDDADILVFYDADEGALKFGWLDAMIAVFSADETCGWLSLNAQPIMDNLIQNTVPVASIGGVDVRVPPYCLMNLACAWRVGALRRIGPLNEPHQWYGGLETDAQPKFRAAGYWVGWLEDYWTQPHTVLADPEYTSYKKHHVGFEQPGFPGSFEEWLKR